METKSILEMARGARCGDVVGLLQKQGCLYFVLAALLKRR